MNDSNIQHPEERAVFIREYEPKCPLIDVLCSKHNSLEKAQDELLRVKNKICVAYAESEAEIINYSENIHQYVLLINFPDKTRNELGDIASNLRELLGFHNEPKSLW